MFMHTSKRLITLALVSTVTFACTAKYNYFRAGREYYWYSG